MMKWVTSCIVLLIVPCLWGGGGVYMGFVATAFALLRGCFGRGKQSGRSEWTRRKLGARQKHFPNAEGVSGILVENPPHLQM